MAPAQSKQQYGSQEQLAREGILPRGSQLLLGHTSTWENEAWECYWLKNFFFFFILHLVEHKHKESTQSASNRVHHQVGDNIDGGGDGGQGDGHPAKEGKGGQGGGSRGKDAEHVLQSHPWPNQVPDAEKVDSNIHLEIKSGEKPDKKFNCQTYTVVVIRGVEDELLLEVEEPSGFHFLPHVVFPLLCLKPLWGSGIFFGPLLWLDLKAGVHQFVLNVLTESKLILFFRWWAAA